MRRVRRDGAREQEHLLSVLVRHSPQAHPRRQQAWLDALRQMRIHQLAQRAVHAMCAAAWMTCE
jgi:hypothetical protein